MGAERDGLKRRLVRILAVLVALVVIATGVLWWLKPWVRDIVLTAPGETGERVLESGIVANFFPAKRADGPGILLLGGSEGGIGRDVTRRAVDLQSKGFSVLSPSYFGARGQPEQLEGVPLETFDLALRWLRGRPEVDPDRVAIVGHSKGAEVTLVLAVRHPDIAAVVAAAPSSVVWDGVDWSNPINPDASWSSDGRPLPSLPYSIFRPWRTVGEGYEDGLAELADHPDAVIEIERAEAPVLLVCGEADTLWPACDMARQVRDRAEANDGPRVRIIAFEHAGHAAFGPRLPDDDPDLSDRWTGGTAEANNDARAAGWRTVIAFLRRNLR